MKKGTNCMTLQEVDKRLEQLEQKIDKLICLAEQNNLSERNNINLDSVVEKLSNAISKL